MFHIICEKCEDVFAGFFPQVFRRGKAFEMCHIKGDTNSETNKKAPEKYIQLVFILGMVY